LPGRGSLHQEEEEENDGFADWGLYLQSSHSRRCRSLSLSLSSLLCLLWLNKLQLYFDSNAFRLLHDCWPDKQFKHLSISNFTLFCFFFRNIKSHVNWIDKVLFFLFLVWLQKFMNFFVHGIVNLLDFSLSNCVLVRMYAIIFMSLCFLF